MNAMKPVKMVVTFDECESMEDLGRHTASLLLCGATVLERSLRADFTGRVVFETSWPHQFLTAFRHSPSYPYASDPCRTFTRGGAHSTTR